MDCASGFIEQAKHCVREGDFSKAFSLLGRAERFQPGLSGISELLAITQVCHAAYWKCICRFHVPRPKTPDWYQILQVDEKADAVTIRKRYRQLALLLHPDKNKNIRAEEAFKLVSEAYACLSDRYARKTFDVERIKSHCTRCYSLKQGTEEDENEALNTDQERLHMFRQKARARVTCLTHDIQTLRRRSRWNADLENAREKLHKRNILFEERRESEVFQPGDYNLRSVLRGRKSVPREHSPVTDSLDGFINRIKKNSRARKVADGSKLFDDTNRDYVDEAVWTTNRIYSKRVSSPFADAFPAKKLFKEDDDYGPINSQPNVESDLLRRQSFPIFTDKTNLASDTIFSTNSKETPPPFHKTSRIGDECSGIRTEYADTPPLCCGPSRKYVLKDHRLRSEELLRTLEKLRQEAKIVAATLDKLKRRVNTTNADLAGRGID